jgi:hypothetical protein
VSLAGLRTTAFPAASAGATDRLDSCIGKFHGLMTATTPAGVRYTRLSLPGMSDGMMRPVTWCGTDDASSITARTRLHSRSALAAVPPVSWISQPVISALRASITAAAASMISARRAGEAAAHSRCALCAAASASSRSAPSAMGISVSVWPLQGSVSLATLPLWPARHRPASGIVPKPL